MNLHEPVPATLFTSSYEMAEIISRHFDVRSIVCEKRSIGPPLFSFCKWRSIPINLVSNRLELEALSLEGDVGISYGFGIIFSRDDINRFRFGIWNIHTGRLPDYRGRHPISWAFLNGETSIGVTIHAIDEHIDRGATLAAAEVRRCMNDDLNDVDAKVASLVDSRLLEEAKRNYVSGNAVNNPPGKYHPALYSGIAIASASEVTSSFLFNAVRAQRTFGGVLISDVRYLDAYFYDNAFSESLSSGTKVVCSDGVTLVLFEEIVSL